MKKNILNETLQYLQENDNEAIKDLRLFLSDVIAAVLTADRTEPEKLKLIEDLSGLQGILGKLSA